MKEPPFLKKEKTKESLDHLKSYIAEKVDFGLILGSFLSRCADFLPLRNRITINSSDIPYMVEPTIPGHRKSIIFGKIYNKNILIFCGRLHLYEGYHISEVVYPVNLLSDLSAENIIITNSSGGINPQFAEDDIMVIKDHINLMFDNPFFGNKYNSSYDYFIDMSSPYDKNLSIAAEKAADSAGIKIVRGVYAGVMGPVLETKAEIKCLHKLGADAVGMSTIPEVIMANFFKIKVLGLSHIRNMTASGGRDLKKFSHVKGFDKEIATGKRFAGLIENILKKA